MTNKEIVILETLLKERMEEYQPSVLDILNRGHDEDLISKYLKYIFKNEPSIISKIIDKTYNKEFNNITIEDVSNEHSIDGQKRIDILIRGKKEDNKTFVILIENKTWSREHGNQTEKYYKWAENNCLEDEKYYIFLIPKGSKQKEAICKSFKTLNYEELYEILSGYEGGFIRDINNTIKNNLIGGEMTELDKLILSNYHELNNKMKEITNKVSEYFQVEYAETINNKFNVNFQRDRDSYRFYKDNWWKEDLDDKKNQYYFFFELHFVDFDFDKILFKATVKRYEEGSVVDKKIQEKFIRYKSYKDDNSGKIRYFVFEADMFDINNEGLVPLSDDWKKELEKQSMQRFESFIPLLDDIVGKIKN